MRIIHAEPVVLLRPHDALAAAIKLRRLKDLAAETGVSIAYLSMFANGKRPMPLSKALAVADAVGQGRQLRAFAESPGEHP